MRVRCSLTIRECGVVVWWDVCGVLALCVVCAVRMDAYVGGWVQVFGV